ncbi:MAG: cytochrome P450 [Alphaproteobacteria bacterium]|nr:cytochrome P450 [Alphaproteobacteria bacterium]
MTDKPLPEGFGFTQMDPDYHAHREERLTAVREQCPVKRDAMFGAFIVSRYDDARGVLTDRTMWRTAARSEEEAAILRLREINEPPELRQEGGIRNIIFLEGEEHARVRSPLQKALYARVAKCKGDVENIVASILDDLATRQGPVDLMEELCMPVPVKVIARVLGLDESRFHQFREWSEGLILSLKAIRTLEETASYVKGALALRAFFDEEVALRRKTKHDDLINDILEAQDHGTQLSDLEIRDNLIGFLVAGNLTTTDLIGNGIYNLLKHPDQLAKLKADPKLMNPAIEEILRYESPVDITVRVASREMEPQGCPIRPHQAIITWLPAANRDPRAYANADMFDIAREAKPHVAFGGGAHICIGAPLARLEAQVVFQMLFERFPKIRLVAETATWKPTVFFHGLQHLRVHLT